MGKKLESRYDVGSSLTDVWVGNVMARAIVREAASNPAPPSPLKRYPSRSAFAGSLFWAADEMGKADAETLRGKYIEIFWDGKEAWFEALVLAYDDQTRTHLVRYPIDGFTTPELLSGTSEGTGVAASAWRWSTLRPR